MIDKIITDDGSTSFFSEKYNQCYHSQLGAYTEALEKHVKPCKILDLASVQSRPNIKILDVCFGLGYNSGVAIEKALEINSNIFLEIVALENDLEILKKIPELEVPENYKNIHNELCQLAKFYEESARIVLENKNFKITVLVGDARQRVKELSENYFDAVFFDPFSPKECPELWEYGFIKDVVSKAKQGVYISTYSSARIVRDNFAKAGCEISEGPKLNRRTGGVVAKVQNY